MKPLNTVTRSQYRRALMTNGVKVVGMNDQQLEDAHNLLLDHDDATTDDVEPISVAAPVEDEVVRVIETFTLEAKIKALIVVEAKRMAADMLADYSNELRASDGITKD